MPFVNANDLCSSCECNIQQPKNREIISSLSDLSTLPRVCIFGEERQKGKVVECDKFREVAGAFKMTCPLCNAEFYVYFDFDDDTNRIDVAEDKCPTCYANLRVQARQEILTPTLKEWKETGEMTKKLGAGWRVYPSCNKAQSVAVMARDQFREFPEFLEQEKKE
ncbi:hypothetical protein KAU88_07895 [Candidatus Bathyarchaeota archaeon]|nr:hypothetical protein [Candidatus Bathyarchaeota archaeon]